MPICKRPSGPQHCSTAARPAITSRKRWPPVSPITLRSQTSLTQAPTPAPPSSPLHQNPNNPCGSLLARHLPLLPWVSVKTTISLATVSLVAFRILACCLATFAARRPWAFQHAMDQSPPYGLPGPKFHPASRPPGGGSLLGSATIAGRKISSGRQRRFFAGLPTTSRHCPPNKTLVILLTLSLARRSLLPSTPPSPPAGTKEKKHI